MKYPSCDIAAQNASPLALSWSKWLLGLAAGTLLALPSPAAVTEAWVARYSQMVSNSVDRPSKIVRDAAGDVIVTGGSSDGNTRDDILTIKYSGGDGSVLWQRRYDGPARNNDSPRGLAVDADNNVIVTGSSHNGTNDDCYTAKYAAADGLLLWEKRHDGGTNSSDAARAVAVDALGNVLITGYSGVYPNEDFYTAKYAAADGELLWEKRYNGLNDANDEAFALALDSDGNVVVTGRSNGSIDNADFYTAKYAAADGGLLWERRYNGLGNGYDQAVAVAVDPSGNVAVTGVSDGTFEIEDHSDFYTAKYAGTNGALMWERRYDGPVNPDGTHVNDYGASVATDASGNVLVTGSSGNGVTSEHPDYYTAKYAAANGAILWQQRYEGPTNSYDYAAAVTVDGSGNAIVTGQANAYDLQTGFVFYTTKYASANGEQLWEKVGPNGGAVAVTVDTNDNVFLAGASNGGPSNDDFYVAKYAAGDGSLLWEQSYNGFGNASDQSSAVAIDGSGNVAVTGSSHNENNSDFYTAKYEGQSGALLWEQRFNGPEDGEDYGVAVATDASGNVIVTGSAALVSTNETASGYYTAKYAAADGSLLWEKSYLSAGGTGHANAVAVDAYGDVVVTGVALNGEPDLDDDYYTAKYSAADGELLWERIYDTGRNDEATALMIDPSGDVVITGSSGTFKYAASDGAIVWEQLYSPNLRSSDGDGKAMALDPLGNVVVTGYTYNDTNNGDYYTAKYAAADGSLLWEKRFNSVSNFNDYAQAVAVDGSGNVFVTGYSGDSENYDYHTIKYAATDGELLWEQHYDDPSNGDDEARAVAVDAYGNAIVTGSSFNGINSDFYTVCYAATDGAILWEKRYDSASNGIDVVATSRSLAVGPGGLVAVTGYAGHGDSRFSGVLYDYATVVYRENRLAISLDPYGVRLHITGTPGHSFDIERAADLAGPWSTLTTLVVPENGVIDYVDSAASPDTNFYRTKES